MKKALIVKGGWSGHEPDATANIMAEALSKQDFAVEVSDTLDRFTDLDALLALDLIIPHWTMGTIERTQLDPLVEAVNRGVGLAGIHGGAGDAFRGQNAFQGMVGGCFICHPGDAGTTYTVHVDDDTHPITKGISDFELTSEQYYMLVDPGNHVLATTVFPPERAPLGQEVVMPVAWTRQHGEGRVFYCSLGHVAETLALPPVLEMITRGLLWAGSAL